MGMRLIALATVLAGLLSVQTGHAEPGPVGGWLMKEPVSMWTFGMAQLRIHFFQLKTPELKSVAKSVDYDWDQNRIEISAWTSEQFTEDRCGEILKAIRDGGGVTNGSLLQTGTDRSFYAGTFASIGYVTKDAPKDYLRMLDDIIVVKALMSGGSCQGELVSTEVLYRK